MPAARLDDRGLLVTCPACGQQSRIPYARLADTGRCPSCRAEIRPPAAPLDVEREADFDRLVSASPVPVVVDYWAAWCGPCRMVAPELEKVAAAGAGRLLVVKVDTERLQGLSARHGIRAIPTMAVFVGGREAARTSGARPAAAIEQFVRDAVRSA